MKKKDTDINCLKNVTVLALALYSVTVKGDCQPSLDFSWSSWTDTD